ncbi:MAG: hypothetical protein ACLFXM_02275 [Acidimicrobiia bacterium]
MAEPHEPTRPVRGPSPASAVGVYVIVLIVLQIFLLSVAIDAFHDDREALAWGAAVTSVLLAGSAGAIVWLLAER